MRRARSYSPKGFQFTGRNNRRIQRPSEILMDPIPTSPKMTFGRRRSARPTCRMTLSQLSAKTGPLMARKPKRISSTIRTTIEDERRLFDYYKLESWGGRSLWKRVVVTSSSAYSWILTIRLPHVCDRAPEAKALPLTEIPIGTHLMPPRCCFKATYLPQLRRGSRGYMLLTP